MHMMARGYRHCQGVILAEELTETISENAHEMIFRKASRGNKVSQIRLDSPDLTTDGECLSQNRELPSVEMKFTSCSCPSLDV